MTMIKPKPTQKEMFDLGVNDMTSHPSFSSSKKNSSQKQTNQKQISFTYFNLHLKIVEAKIKRILSKLNIKLRQEEILDIAKSVVVDVYWENQKYTHLQKSLVLKSSTKFIKKYLAPYIFEKVEEGEVWRR